MVAVRATDDEPVRMTCRLPHFRKAQTSHNDAPASLGPRPAAHLVVVRPTCEQSPPRAASLADSVRGTLLRRTPWRREMDSNHRYRIRNNPFWLAPFGPAIHLPQQKPALSSRGPTVRIHLPPAGRCEIVHTSELIGRRRRARVIDISPNTLSGGPAAER